LNNIPNGKLHNVIIYFTNIKLTFKRAAELTIEKTIENDEYLYSSTFSGQKKKIH